MKRKKHRPIFVRNCDYCGTELQTNEPGSDSYVINAEHKIFCKIHYVGEEPIKDCLEDYIRSKKNAKSLWKNEKEKEQRRLQSNSKEQLQKRQKEKEKIIKKFDDYLFELKQKQRRRNASK